MLSLCVFNLLTLSFVFPLKGIRNKNFKIENETNLFKNFIYLNRIGTTILLERFISLRSDSLSFD